MRPSTWHARLRRLVERLPPDSAGGTRGERRGRGRSGGARPGREHRGFHLGAGRAEDRAVPVVPARRGGGVDAQTRPPLPADARWRRAGVERTAKCRRAARARRSTSCPQPPATVACVPLSARGAGRAAGGLHRAFSDLSSSSSRTKLRGTITTSPDWPAMAIPTMATQGVGTACSWHGRGRPRGPLDSAAIHKQPGSGRESVRQNVSSQQGGQGASLGAARARGAL